MRDDGEWTGEVAPLDAFDGEDPLGVEGGQTVELDEVRKARDAAFTEKLKATFGAGTAGREVLEHIKENVSDSSVLEARGLGCPVGLPPALLMAFREGQRSVIRAIIHQCDAPVKEEKKNAGRA